MKVQKIGRVGIKLLDGAEGESGYTDGDKTENRLLQLFKAGLSDESRLKLLRGRLSWAMRYHLAYERGDLLGWYDFPKGSSILEVGAGCGGITESLVKSQGVKVTANELSERRAHINAHRNKDAANLEIVIGNLADYQPNEKFDYVVCVGVLEYAGSFVESEERDPYTVFLNKLRKFLKPNGKLLLAIENQLGFKYLAGAREDHTGEFGDSLNDYPGPKRVRTFSKHELEQRLSGAGFRSTYFYYPFPDYKLPTITYSDDYYPGMKGVHIPMGRLPVPNPDQPRDFIFSEQAFSSVLERANLFREHANSFLVEATA